MRHLVVAVVLALAACAAAQTGAPSKATRKPAAQPTQAQLDAVPRITIAQLKELLRTDKGVVLIDARSAGAWNSDNTMMPGAIRVPPMEAARHLGELRKLRNRQVVAYCT